MVFVCDSIVGVEFKSVALALFESCKSCDEIELISKDMGSEKVFNFGNEGNLGVRFGEFFE